MIAIFSLEPRSIVMAYLLSRTRGAKPAQFDPSKQYFFDDVIDARKSSWDDIYSEFRDNNGKMDFLEDSKLYEVISKEIFWALRARARDRAALTLEILRQIEQSGSKSYLSEATPEAKEMRHRIKRVLAEFNRALQYVRFVRSEKPPLSISKASFDSDIADMVLRAEAMRCPGNTVAVYDEKSVRILAAGIPYLARTRKVPLSPDRRNFNQFWTGFPESGSSFIAVDEVHMIQEIPPIVFPMASDNRMTEPGKEVARLDDFV